MKKFLLKEIAEKFNVTLVGNPSISISGIGGLDDAKEYDISFLANPKYIDSMQKSKAGAICVQKGQDLPLGKNFLICENPSQTFQSIVELFIPPLPKSCFESGIHPTAVIDPTAKIDQEASIGPYCIISANVKIGPGCKLHGHVFIGAESSLDEDCEIHPHVTLRERCLLGKRVILQPGAVIGSCGFGYLTDANGKHKKLAQLGSVIIDDDVEIGANTTIDRARFHETRIGLGTKIDNLVQIGHNVEIGKNNLIVSQVGIAGSSKTGDYVVLAGQVGVVGHVEVCSGTIVGPTAALLVSIETEKIPIVIAVI